MSTLQKLFATAARLGIRGRPNLASPTYLSEILVARAKGREAAFKEVKDRFTEIVALITNGMGDDSALSVDVPYEPPPGSFMDRKHQQAFLSGFREGFNTSLAANLRSVGVTHVETKNAAKCTVWVEEVYRQAVGTTRK